MKRIIFALTSARAGTLYLSHLFRNNIPDCVCRHEPFFDWGNPTMFGRAIYDAYAGRVERIRSLLEKKRAYIQRLPGNLYLESSHAFLKSSYLAALDVFPALELIRVIRDPLKVARSEAYRQDWRRRVHAPFHFYKAGDNRRHFVWALTGNEPIFRHFDSVRLSTFQWYLLQWIEIENRAARFLEEHDLQSRCFTLETPELSSPEKLKSMFDFFGLKTARPELVLAGRRNRSFGYSAAKAAKEEAEAKTILEALPAPYFEIFRREPYIGYSWSKRLQKQSEPHPPPQTTAQSQPGAPARGVCA